MAQEVAGGAAADVPANTDAAAPEATAPVSSVVEDDIVITCMHRHSASAEYGKEAIIKSKTIRVVAVAFAMVAAVLTAVAASSGDKDFDTVQNVHWAKIDDNNGHIAYIGNYKLALENADAKNSQNSDVQRAVKYSNCVATYEATDGSTKPITFLTPEMCKNCEDAFEDIEGTTVVSIIIHLIGVGFHIMHMSESMNSGGVKYLTIVWYLVGFIVSVVAIAAFKNDCYDDLEGGEKDYGASFGLTVATLVLDLIIVGLVAMAETAPIPFMQSVPCTGLFWYNLCCWTPEVKGEHEGKETSTNV